MIDAEKMKASWLEAVANGEADGFARHWMPDILDALKLRQDVVEAAEICAWGCETLNRLESAESRLRALEEALRTQIARDDEEGFTHNGCRASDAKCYLCRALSSPAAEAKEKSVFYDEPPVPPDFDSFPKPIKSTGAEEPKP